MAERRRSFGPVVLAGLVTAGLAALAAGRSWVGGASTGDARTNGSLAGAVSDSSTTYPLASALSLVLLACWGVLLVTRGRVRRTFAVLAAVAAVGLVAAVVVGGLTLPGDAGSSYDRLMGRSVDTGLTAWFWTAAVAAVLAVVPAVAAVRLAPGWPEMGSRYDAPTAPTGADETGRGGQERADAGPPTEQELWKALDEGRDPTDVQGDAAGPSDPPGPSTGGHRDASA